MPERLLVLIVDTWSWRGLASGTVTIGSRIFKWTERLLHRRLERANPNGPSLTVFVNPTHLLDILYHVQSLMRLRVQLAERQSTNGHLNSQAKKRVSYQGEVFSSAKTKISFNHQQFSTIEQSRSLPRHS